MDIIFGFGVIDLLIIAILFISLIIGFKLGFIEKFFRLIRKFAALVVSILLAKPASMFLINQTTVEDNIANKIVAWITKQGSVFATEITPETRTEVIANTLGKFPKFLADPLEKKLMELTENITGPTTFSQILSQPLVQLVMLVIAFIGLFIATLIAVWILKHIFKALTKNRIIGGFDRLLGGALGLAEGAIIVLLLLFGISFIVQASNWTSVKDFLNTDMELTTSEFSIAKFLYNNNIIAGLITRYAIW